MLVPISSTLRAKVGNTPRLPVHYRAHAFSLSHLRTVALNIYGLDFGSKQGYRHRENMQTPNSKERPSYWERPS